jgi:hypothetical protein
MKPQHPKPSSRTFASVEFSTAAAGVSEEIDITGLTLSCIQFSTNWTNARIGFQASVDLSTNFYGVTNTDGDFLTYAVNANTILVFDPAPFAGLQRIKLTSMTSAGVAVPQDAERTVVLGLSEYVEAN